jgi:hypothetical protein
MTFPEAIARFGDRLSDGRHGFALQLVDAEDLHDMIGRLCLLCARPVAGTWKVLLVGDRQQFRFNRPVCASCAARGRDTCMAEIMARINVGLGREGFGRLQ